MKQTLADGQAATTATAIYELGGRKGSSSALLTYLSLFNTNAATQTVIVYVKRHGSSNRTIGRFVLVQNQRVEVFAQDQPYLSPGDQVLLETTTASALDYVLAGEVE
jgi:hypothetical protein